jgi:fatty acid desaturase
MAQSVTNRDEQNQMTEQSMTDQSAIPNADTPLVDSSVGAAVRLSDVLTRDEMQPFMARSDARAWFMVLANFALIVVAFALPALWPNPLTVLACLLLLGGRQLGLAVLYHDCAHGVFFRTRWLNDVIGHWVCGGLLNTSMYAYRAYHLKHHQFAGTRDDPDLGIALAYPTSRESLKRKITRDLTGRTGVKALKGQVARFDLRRNLPFLISHTVLLSVLWAAGIPWAYLLWWLAYVFVHQLITRLRFMGEHGVAVDRLSDDARENTCTTEVAWWERLLVAPNYVNYHLEHHLSAAVPCYRLAPLHELLKAKGFFDRHPCLSKGYRDVLVKAVARRPKEPVPA